VTQAVFSYLRAAKGPLTTKQMAERVMSDRGLNTLDKALCRLMVKRVGAACKHHRNLGRMKSIRGEDGFMLWELTE
jgi:hypothetical protein